MKNYPISALETYSGIKSHTLRIWEKRYGLFNPYRSSINFRFYGIEDLVHLLKLSILCKSGHRISHLSTLDHTTLDMYLNLLEKREDVQFWQLNQLIISMIQMDIQSFENILNKCVFLWGIDDSIRNIIIPFIERVQLYSCKNCDCEIDFVVTALRQKIILGIETANANVPSTSEKTALLFLPEGEHYDLLLLYFNYLIRSFGLRVLYMGTNVSENKVIAVTARKRPEFLVTYTTSKQMVKLGEIKQHIENLLPNSVFMHTGFEGSTSLKPNFDLKYVHHTEVSEVFS